ncbi:MAG TPA: NAD-dependent epimerase/dehydratase family protein [Gaiellaceae bacterium]|nr:NAD-dependent epimerase/dehydratase family protein [Gaiellaceae bacterium]
MSRRAVLIGGTGQIGRATARALAEDGWEVVAVSRSGKVSGELAALGVRGAAADRAEDAQLRAAIGDGADVVVDMVAYNREHGEQLNSLPAGSLIAISSGSVYVDDDGKGFGDEDFPRFPVPIPETQRSVEPADDGDYARGKAALEEELLAGPLPATLLRAGAIHGPGAELPRELFFVKRAMDGRRSVALAWQGRSIFHPVSAVNIAELIRLAAANPGDRILNAGDPDPPTTLDICHAIGAALEYAFEPVLLPGGEYDNPWAVPSPRILSMTAAERELGYRPVATYPEAVRETCTWLVGELESGRTWDGTYLADMLDYEAEDAVLEEHG